MDSTSYKSTIRSWMKGPALFWRLVGATILPRCRYLLPIASSSSVLQTHLHQDCMGWSRGTSCWDRSRKHGHERLARRSQTDCQEHCKVYYIHSMWCFLTCNQMHEYYKIHPTAVATSVASQDTRSSSNDQTVSEYDKHRNTLLTQDTHEGWASELRWYLGTMQWDVTKETDIVQWWQVCYLIAINHFLLIENSVGQFRTLSNTCAHRTWCSSLSGIIHSLWTAILWYKTNCYWPLSITGFENIWRTHNHEVCIGKQHLW